MAANLSGYKGPIRQISIILFIILAFYLALVRPLVKQGLHILQSQIDEAVLRLERYMPEKKAALLPTKGNIQALKASQAQSEQNYQELKNFIDPDKSYLPEGTQEVGLYFIEQLHITTKRLKRQASSLKIKIPSNFGFSEKMPQDTHSVELLLKELDAVDRVASLLMKQGVEEISLIKSLGSLEQRDQKTQKLFYQELPMQLSFLCHSSTLLKFLYQIKDFSPALIVKDIIVKRAEGMSLQVEMVLTGLVVS